MISRYAKWLATILVTPTLATLVPLAPALAQQPGARETAVQEAGPTLSPAEQAVWEMEEAYWRYVEAGDVESYLGRWQEDFVGWPCFTWSPVGKEGVGAWVESIRDNGWTLTYQLRPRAVRLFGDVAVAHYAAEYVYQYGDGTAEGEGEWRKFTHTWMKMDDRWQIIGGMCADQAPVRRSRR